MSGGASGVNPARKTLSWLLFAMILPSVAFGAGREPVLKQVDLPHSYYWRELYLPQLTTGPSAASFLPDSQSLVYSMAGSLWRQSLDSEDATELTHAAGAYDYQPDVASDGGSVVFVRYDGKAMELWRLDLSSGREQALTFAGAVNVEPRLSPDGHRLAWVSTEGSGHFNLYLADIDAESLHGAHRLIGEHQSTIDRYYYSVFDHAINPSWSPDGRALYFVGNHEVAWGTGDVYSVSLSDPAHPKKILREETSWNARPESSPDGHRLLITSYHGRQEQQLWLTTPDGTAPLPLTFGAFDRRNPRWAPDGERIATISNQTGNTTLQVIEVTGGRTRTVTATRRHYKLPMATLRLDIHDEHGKSVPARVSIIGSDSRAEAPQWAWMHADDGFDRSRQTQETHYFHCNHTCTLELPAGATKILVQHGFAHEPWERTVSLKAGPNPSVTVDLQPNALPPAFGDFISADLHVHMNYGGHYRNTPARLEQQAQAEDLNLIFNLIVNKEERMPDVAYAMGVDPASTRAATITHAQEYHTSLWGHMGLLNLSDHLLTPGFASYRHTALASPYPHNGVIADLAHAQGALVGYVHPFDTAIDPATEKKLTHLLPADVLNGKVDYMEIVSFADHIATAGVWYRLLNLGFHLPAGAGTDAMTDYASLRGPVGMNRVFLDTGGKHDPVSAASALKAGRGFASNGPLLGLDIDGRHPGDHLKRANGSAIPFKVSLRSPVAVDHLELIQNGKVIRAFDLGRDHRHFDAEGALDLDVSGWLLLRAWNDGADPIILDIYPYATTNPIDIELPAARPDARSDAAYFAAWMDRVIEAVGPRDDFNNAAEKTDTMTYLQHSRDVYRQWTRTGARP
jgi:TolB protein